MNIFKILISAGAVALIVGHAIWPSLTIDTITLGLLIVALLPWASSFISSAKFPGGWEVKFQDLKQASNKIEAAAQASPAAASSISPSGSFNSAPFSNSVPPAVQVDPNLALVSVRIEIEKRLRALASNNNLQANVSLNRMLGDLAKKEVLPEQVVGPLRDIIAAGNSAAHGATVEPQVQQWVAESGAEVIGILDNLLRK